MSNLTTVTLTAGIPTAGTGTVSTIDNLIAQGAPVSAGLPTGANNIGAFNIQDASSNQRALVQAFHNADNQTIGGTSYGLLTGGVAQLINVMGNLDRQRGTGVDNTPATGISTGIQTAAMFFKTFSNSVTAISTGSNTVFARNTSGTIGNVPWSIANGSVLVIDPGTANQETVIVTAANSTTFTANFSFVHPANTIIQGFTFNQGRDAAGENDGATGAGTSLAAGYEYNGGDPSGGQYDRNRSINAKGLASFAITSGGTQGSNSIVTTATPTGLTAGMKILLSTTANPGAGTFESVNIDLSYISGSSTVPLSTTIVNSATYLFMLFDTFSALGAGINGFLPFGVGIEEEAIYDPVSGKYFIGRTATSDAMGANNIPADGVALFNGTTFDRARGVIGDGQAATGIPAETELLFNGTTYDRQRSAPGSTGVVAVSSDQSKATYRYAQLGVTPVALPTDFLMIRGSSTKTLRIKMIKLSGVATANGNLPVQLIRRSSGFTVQGSATYTAVTAGKQDTSDAAATANVQIITTANFTTLGTAVGGPITADRLQLLQTGVGIGGPSLTWDFSTRQDKALIIRGSTDFIFINLNGSAVPAGGVIDFEIEIEEDNS